jgi:hypothetical protein
VGAGAFFSKVPKSAYIGGSAIVLLGVVSLSLWLVLRDTWERDHGTELRQKSEAAILLIRNGNHEEGMAKYHELIAFVGDRQLRDPSLRQDTLRAKDAAESARKQMEERRLQVLLQKEKELKDKLHQEVQGRWRMARADEDNQMFATFTEKDLSIVTIILGKRETSSFPYTVVKAVGDRAIRIQHTGSKRTDLLTVAPDGTELSVLIEIDRSGTQNDGIVPAIKFVRSPLTEVVPTGRTLGSLKTLTQILDTHKSGLLVADQESTRLRQDILTEACRKRTAASLDAHMFEITVTVKDVEYDENNEWARIGFAGEVELEPGDAWNRKYLRVSDPLAYIKMTKTDAVNIKPGDRLAIQGRVSLGYTYGERGKTNVYYYSPGELSYGPHHLGESFVLTHDTCRLIK